MQAKRLNHFQQVLLTAFNQQLTALLIETDNTDDTQQTMRLQHSQHHRLSHYSIAKRQYLHHDYHDIYQGISSASLINNAQNHQKVFIKWQYIVSDIVLSDIVSEQMSYQALHNQQIGCFSPSFDLNKEIALLNGLGNVSPMLTIKSKLLMVLPLHYQCNLPLTLQAEKNTQDKDKVQGRLSLMILPFFDMGSLQQIIKQFQPQQPTAEYIHHLILQTALALQQVHDAGFIHGDVKPSNFLLASSLKDDALPLVYVTDFALSQPINQPPINAPSDICINGTPAYLAPECWTGENLSISSDIYAFGLMTYQLLTHTKAGQGSVASELTQSQRSQAWAAWHTKSNKPMLSLPPQHQSWQNIITLCTQYNPNKRPKNMQAVIKLMPIA